MQSGPIVDPRSIREDTADSSTRTSLTFTGIARRHYRLILAFVAGAMLLGTLGALLLKPTYMATATLMIDPRKIELLRKQSVVGGMRFDDSTYPTHVTVLKTKSIALSVIKALDLTKDPEFVGPPRSFWETAFGLVFGEDEQRAGPTEANLTERALAVFEKRRMITRVQTSHLITVSFTASDPDKAARIATAIAEAYIAEELDAKHQAAYRASSWLKEHITELRDQANAAERAVADFKEQNALVFTAQPDPCLADPTRRQTRKECLTKCNGRNCREAPISQADGATKCPRFRRGPCVDAEELRRANATPATRKADGSRLAAGSRQADLGPLPDGSLLEQNTLSEVTTELVKGWTATAEAKAREEQVRSVLNQQADEPALADAWNSRLIAKLRSEYGALARREALWARKYGANHQAVIDLRMQMLEVNRNINNEMRRVAESYKSDYEVARKRDQITQKNLADAVEQAQRAEKARAQLRELESYAATSRSLYNMFIQRIAESVPQQSFPFHETRLVAPARPPNRKIQPKSKLIILLSGWIGMVLGVGAAVVRDVVGTGVRTSAEAEDALGVKCVAILPRIKLDPGEAAADEGQQDKAYCSNDAYYSIAVTSPRSRFAEAVRSMKLAIDLSGPADRKVIGVTSAFPNEGKSTLSANLAQLIAASGGSAVLVDADLRNPTLSAVFAPDPVATWSDVLANRATLDEALWHGPEHDLTFLSAGASPARARSSTDISNFAAISRIIADLRRRYAYVIVDLPPMSPIADVRATAEFIDSYLCVVAWSGTNIVDLRHHFSAAPEIYRRLIGVVLNKADMSVIGRYDLYDSISNDPKHYYPAHAAGLCV